MEEQRETAVLNYQESIREIERFVSFVYELEPAIKLADLIRKFGKVSRYWQRNWTKLKNDTDEWKEFNQRFNNFSRKEIVISERYLSIGADKIYDYTEVVGKQLIVMLVSIFEVYLNQKFQSLILQNPLLYLKNLEKSGDITNLSLKNLNKLEFNLEKIVEFLIHEEKIKPNFQNFESTQKYFSYLSISVPNDSLIEFIIDIRHVMIHNYGKPDKKFLKKYSLDLNSVPSLSIGKDLIEDAIISLNKIVDKIEKQSIN